MYLRKTREEEKIDWGARVFSRPDGPALIVTPYPARFPDLKKKKILNPSLCYGPFLKNLSPLNRIRYNTIVEKTSCLTTLTIFLQSRGILDCQPYTQRIIRK